MGPSPDTASTLLQVWRAHRWFTVSAALCLITFAGVITGWTGRFLVRESFGDFYDHQAASLLQGRLDIPYEAIGLESFVVAGKHYGYFGPTPALFRIPFALAGVWFGELSRSLLVAYYAASLLAGYLLLLHAVQLVRGRGAIPRPLTVVLWVLATGLGSTLFFLGSRAYIYHEAILCGAMFALWGTWGALRHLAAPAGRWWIGSLLCGLLSVHARPSAGLFALAALGFVALTLAWRERQRTRAAKQPLDWTALRRPVALAIFAAAAIASFNAFSYLKFGTFEGCPLRLNVQYDEARLARIDGRQFHLANLLPNAGSYLWRAGLAARPSFPYLVATAPDRNAPGTKLDLTEPTVALPIGMPVLTLLATLGAAAAFATHERCRPALLVIGGSALPALTAMLCAIAVTHRYTADFVPGLVASGAFGLAAFDAWVSRWRVAAVAGLLAVAGLNVAFTLALTMHHRGEVVWGVATADRQKYATWRETIDRLLGRSDPAGYAVSRLPIREIDANAALWVPLHYARNSATRARAIALAEDARRTYPDLPQVHFLLGELYASEEGGRRQAISFFAHGLKLKPDFALGHQALADLLVADNRLAEGVDRYQIALRLNPGSAPGWNNLGIACVRLNRLNDALAAFEQAVRLDPSFQGNLDRIRADLQARR